VYALSITACGNTWLLSEVLLLKNETCLEHLMDRPKIQLKIRVKQQAASDETETESGISFMHGRTIEETYRNKDLREHVYTSPDTYAGSIDPEEDEQWVMDEDSGRMVMRKLTVREAFYKIFDEVLVNALDQQIRLQCADAALKKVTRIQITLDRENGRITVENDGEGIDVVMHKEYGIYVPQLLFAKFLTSVNYDEGERRIVGGKNGYGAKITNVLSKEFTVTTVDRHRKLKFTQTCRENMREIAEPQVEAYSKVPFTRISYVPDYARFNIADPVNTDEWLLLARRAYDAAACTDSSVQIWLNGQRLPTRTFEDYMNCYIGPRSETKRVFQVINDRWQVGVCLSPDGEFHQVSFVNGIFTDRGGRHVDHVVDQLTRRLVEHFNTKSKRNKELQLKPAFIKKNLFVFVRSTIENPNFDTQTKRKLTTMVKNFGSRADLTDEFIEQVAKLGILERAKSLAEFKERESLSKEISSGSRARKVYHPKLVDAAQAGGRQARRCTIVFTEGDSAATFMASGLKGIPEAEHQYWGYFPLRGKLLNVRQATVKQLANNEELKMIARIVGLREGEDYSSQRAFDSLRYGRVMILADADDDGHHIKGLVMNYIVHNWPSLARRDGFLCDMSTPINKALRCDKKGAVVRAQEFYSQEEFRRWQETTDHSGWKMRYYKGLGTYDPKEAREFCANMRLTLFYWSPAPVMYMQAEREASAHMFELAFAKKYENARKDWLNTGAPEPLALAERVNRLSYDQFIDRKMKLFSMADNIRSIPSLMDGMKPAQRKVLAACFKRDLRESIKVAQLGGYVSEHMDYHHGEAALFETIVGMARNYVGVNNINLLVPEGQFGSRRGGGPKMKKGDDSAHPRYIFTRMSYITCLLFNKEDRALLNYHLSDGQQVEPDYFLPVIPMVLANGVLGIGTGYSTTIPCYNPMDLIRNVRQVLASEPQSELTPWYRGYNGRIVSLGASRYLTVGDYVRTGPDTIRVRELPVGAKNCKSFTAYIAFLNTLLDEETAKLHGIAPAAASKRGAKRDGEDAGAAAADDSDDEGSAVFREAVVQDYQKVKDTDTDCIIDITFKPGVLERELANNEDYRFEKRLCLAYQFATSNMHLYDESGRIQKYGSPQEIIESFCKVRLPFYAKRRGLLIDRYMVDLAKCSAKYRFVVDIMEERVDIRRKSKADVAMILSTAEPPYPRFTSETAETTENEESTGSIDGYDYLLRMPIHSFTRETLERLKAQMDKTQGLLEEITGKTEQDLWQDELTIIEREYTGELDSWIKDNDITILHPGARGVAARPVAVKLKVAQPKVAQPKVAEPLEAIKPLEPVKHLEAVKPLEPVKHLEAVKPLEAVKLVVKRPLVVKKK
jgi:DNA topoisomerase-2